MGKEFGDRLAELLKSKGITQKKLAEKAGVTEAAMSHYIKGDRVPRTAVLARIAENLETTSEYLMNGTTDGAEDVGQVVRLIARNAAYMSKEDKMKIIGILMGEE